MKVDLFLAVLARTLFTEIFFQFLNVNKLELRHEWLPWVNKEKKKPWTQAGVSQMRIYQWLHWLWRWCLEEDSPEKKVEKRLRMGQWSSPWSQSSSSFHIQRPTSAFPRAEKGPLFSSGPRYRALQGTAERVMTLFLRSQRQNKILHVTGGVSRWATVTHDYYKRWVCKPGGVYKSHQSSRHQYDT